MEESIEVTLVDWGMYWVCIGIMEKTMEATIRVYWGYIGIMEKRTG